MNDDVQRLEYVLDGAGLGAWDWWLETNAVQFDSRWCRMLGLDPAAVRMELATWEDRVHPDDLPPCSAEISRYLRGDTPVYESLHRMRHADGHWVWVLDRGRISAYSAEGKPLRFTGTHFEMTRYKEQQELSEDVQRMAHIGAWDLDLATSEAHWTDEVYRIHGLEIGTPTNKVMGISFYAPHDRPKISQCVQACTTGTPYDVELELIDLTGTVKWVRTTGEPVFDAEGRVRRIRGIFQDITAQKRTVEQLQRERSQSVHASKLALLGEMSAGLAHEINNPLAVITGSLELLDRLRADPEKFSAKKQTLERAAYRIEKIVHGLRKFSRRTGDTPMQDQVLASIVRETLTLTGERAKRLDCRVEVNCPEKLLVHCDEVEIEQVLVNLVNNALDAVAGEAERWIKIEAQYHGGQGEGAPIGLRVSNSGPRIAEGVAARLFQPFFTTKAPGLGTGLGLSISRSILERHGATIALLPGPTCFEILFPVQRPTALADSS